MLIRNVTKFGRSILKPFTNAGLSAAQVRNGLLLPIHDDSEDCNMREYFRARGRLMAQNNDWDLLTSDIEKADKNQDLTDSGARIAQLMIWGAASNAVQSLTSDPAESAEALNLIETARHQFPENYAMAMILAEAYMGFGWHYRGADFKEKVKKRDLALFTDYFSKAEHALKRFDAIALGSLNLAAMRCDLLAALGDTSKRVIMEYDDYIDLAPGMPFGYRQMGVHLLPRWYGNYDILIREAHRNAARTHDIWGQGGYYWTLCDAMILDPEVLMHVDLEFLRDSVHDIMTRNSNQLVCNHILASCLQATQELTRFEGDKVMKNAAQRALDKICFDTISFYLKELYPMVWGNVILDQRKIPDITTDEQVIAVGRDHGLASIATFFTEEIKQGNQIHFTNSGPMVQHA